MNMKAMILAAGRGNRMYPLTNDTPKPMLKVAGIPMIEHQIQALRQANIIDIMINVSYLADIIIDYLGDGSHLGVNIKYSLEKPTSLGTGGGILKALPFFGESPFLVISADIMSDYPLKNLIHNTLNSLAHIVLVDNPIYHPKGDFSLKPNHLIDLTGPKLNYSGIARIHPQLFANCQQHTFGVSTLFLEAINNKQLTGEYYQGQWFNVGNPEQTSPIK